MSVTTLTYASSLTGGEPYRGPDVAQYRGKVGLVCFFIGELHMFGCLMAAYVLYLPASKASSTPPQEVLHLPMAIGATIVLLASSPVSYLALRAFRQRRIGAFHVWWLLAIILGTLFLVATALEWNDLITNRGLSLTRNFFGTTFFPLVGLHAGHVTIGLLAMLVLQGLVLVRQVTPERIAAAELIDWFWHFVDAVWIAIFSIVYLLPRSW